MRFDDTNPAKEDMEYVTAILDDVRWLVAGSTHHATPAPWDGSVRHASDYFPVILEAATYLIKQGKAYVDDLSPEEMKAYRGTLTGKAKYIIHLSFIYLFIHSFIHLSFIYLFIHSFIIYIYHL